MKLVIVESPSKAKTIEKYLGDGYRVTSSVGHIRDLPKSNKNAVSVEDGFIPQYVISPRKEKVVQDLKREAGKADEVILATDPDREGEAIAWHITEALDLDAKKTKRIVFHEITKEAVQEALKHPRSIDMDLKRAQEARRVLDRLFGYDLSGLIWKKVRYGLSAGRVQSPALRLLMEREREIRAFTPEDYFVLEGIFSSEHDSKTTFTLTCTEEPKEESEATRIADVAQSGSWTVQNIQERQEKRNPKAPFTTSTLQQAASSRLNFSPSRTMRIAQKLYESGHITYMRTDSTTLSTQAQQSALSLIKSEYGDEYVQPRNYKTKSKNAQEAHEAVRPTNIKQKTRGRTADEKKLYQLIWERTIASQMKEALLMKTKVTANVSDQSIPDFAITGSRVLFPGWLAVDTRARGDDVILPKLSEGDALNLESLEVLAKQTQPPNRYSEARLVKELEKRGIGRPSTYASIIQTLIDRGYVDKEGRALIPTDTGDVVSSFLENYFGTYISDTFTAELEDELDGIATGDASYQSVLSNFYTTFTKDLKEKQDIPKLTNLGDADENILCPKCGKKMVIKLGKGGKFLSCATFPECDGARTIDGEEIADDVPIGTHPDTGDAIYVLSGPYGPYVQLGEKEKGKKPKRASIPKDQKPEEVTIKDALKYLSLPRELGEHPETGKKISANIGRFGPYIVHDGDFRSLKEDDVYTVTLKRALEILKEPKKKRGSKKKKKK